MALQGLVAIEAKLTDWQRAIDQAQRHLWFAQSSYVLLATRGSNAVERAAAGCREAGVGLIGPDSRGQLRVLVQAGRSPLRPEALAWRINERIVDLHSDSGEVHSSEDEQSNSHHTNRHICSFPGSCGPSGIPSGWPEVRF
jgi:hypothetical protein